jgi:hypothetical protein
MANRDLDSDIKKRSCPADESELHYIIRSVQKAIAAMRSDMQDLRAEYSEDMAEVKQELRQLRRNAAWISRDAA